MAKPPSQLAFSQLGVPAGATAGQVLTVQLVNGALSFVLGAGGGVTPPDEPSGELGPAPASVIAKGLDTTVWLSYDDAGRKLSLIKNLIADAAEFEAGANGIDAGAAVPGIYMSQPGTYTRWDFSGFTPYWNTDGLYIYQNCKFKHSPTAMAAVVGQVEEDLDIDIRFIDCEFDYESADTNFNGLLLNCGDITITGCRFGPCNSTQVRINTTGVVKIENNYFDAIGTNPTLDESSGHPMASHCEHISLFGCGAGSYIRNNFFDCEGFDNDVTYIMSGSLLLTSQFNPTTILVEKNIFRGTLKNEIPYVMQGGSSNTYACKITLKDNVTDIGLYGHVSFGAGTQPLDFQGDGNIRLDTGAAIVQMNPGITDEDVEPPPAGEPAVFEAAPANTEVTNNGLTYTRLDDVTAPDMRSNRLDKDLTGTNEIVFEFVVNTPLDSGQFTHTHWGVAQAAATIWTAGLGEVGSAGFNRAGKYSEGGIEINGAQTPPFIDASPMTIMVAYHPVNKTLRYCVDDVWNGPQPVTLTGTLRFAFGLHKANDTVTINDGGDPFTNTIPVGAVTLRNAP